jgi:hypothetical protein
MAPSRSIPHAHRNVYAFGPERVLWASDHTQAVKPGLLPHPIQDRTDEELRKQARAAVDEIRGLRD